MYSCDFFAPGFRLEMAELLFDFLYCSQPEPGVFLPRQPTLLPSAAIPLPSFDLGSGHGPKVATFLDLF